MTGQTATDLRIALVGLGGMGTVHHTTYQHIAGTKVVAAVGASEADRVKADAWGVPLFPNISALLESTEVDVVDICTPTFLHAEQALSAITGGKHVICEKPAALSGADARAMVAAANQAGVQLYVAHVLQFFPESLVLHDLVASQKYGRVLDAKFQRLSARPEWAQGGWLFDKARSGLVPYDLHIHDLDLIVSLFGVPENATLVKASRPGLSFDELCRFTYDYPELQVVGEAGWLNAAIPFTAGWRVLFENALVQTENGAVVAYPWGQEPERIELMDEPKIPTGINVPPTGTYLKELTHFTTCARAGTSSPIVPLERVVAVLELLEHLSA
ncbi:MAG: Gfo/Idh/MocA family oxidoreductase [Propionibacteriaceae bacterium]|jgi:predicted dehydrogenase|nr:Gfo/Idh/MocA family oxidoreductase [Propionibacteriaceae bacterium]